MISTIINYSIDYSSKTNIFHPIPTMLFFNYISFLLQVVKTWLLLHTIEEIKQERGIYSRKLFGVKLLISKIDFNISKHKLTTIFYDFSHNRYRVFI
jgi:hypothetical protein